jgi:hypothetical protein
MRDHLFFGIKMGQKGTPGDAKRRKVPSSKVDDIDARVTGERSTELDSHADQSCVGDNATSYMSGPTVPFRSVPS